MGFDLPTSKTLVGQLRDSRNEAAWEEFVEIYTPLLTAYFRKHGLQASDADDVTQVTLLSVSRAIQKFEYDRGRGTFRGWLLTVARSKLRDHFSSGKRHPRGSADTEVHRMLDQQPGREDEDVWEEEYRCRLFDWAAEKVRGEFRDSTWEAFVRHGMHNESAAGVAESLGLSVNAVYIAKNRVVTRLREKIQSVTGEP